MQQVTRDEEINNPTMCQVSVVSLVHSIARIFSAYRLSYLAPYAMRMGFIVRLCLAIKNDRT